MNTSKALTLSDLHTVTENDNDGSEDDEMNPAAFIHNKKEYHDHVMQVIEYDTILEECRIHVNKIKKVKEFLLTCVHRRRFKEKQFGSMMI